MKNRLSKLSRAAYFMLLLLAVSGVSTSCKDEYVLDDEKPTWLSTSIYEGLDEDGHYKNYLRLLADPDVNPTDARPLTEVLSRTGSKTVFVANDDAWNEFYQRNALLPESNPWHTATSYENLSVSQKKLLIHTSMLNNAIVMENLSSSSSNIDSRGDFMRRYTDVEATDTITYLDGNSLPVNYNERNGENDYWWRFREENGGKGLYMVTDSSLSMMLHFTSEHMTKNNVTDEDFAIFMGEPRNTADVHIYDAKLIAKDSVAENGYINKTSKVIVPLPNMAEAIRTSGRTNIFSHMLDRWSAPFFNYSVTEAYKNVMAARGIQWTDSIFTKRYFSKMSYGHRELSSDPDGQPVAGRDVGLLKFDPGWNAIAMDDDRWRTTSATAPQYDMTAMFVPDDEALWQYFSEGGGGWQLIKTYYLREGLEDEIPYTAPTNLDELYYQIDQIPLGTLGSLLNVVMFPSFTGSVPSKMTKLRDDAQEQLFFPEDIDHIKGTILANNGMIYITDKVYGPANYTSVAAPAYISNTNTIMKWAIYNGDAETVKGTDYMGLNYYAYLKAMQSRFALFMPSDEAMKYYYDPVSFKSQKGRILHFYYRNQAFPIAFYMYAYTPQTGEIGQLYNLERMSNGEITNRMKDILESHTIVLDGVDEINSGVDEYYLAKNGAAVKVTRENGRVVKAQGGFQLENEGEGIEGSIGAANRNAYTEIRGMQVNNVVDEQKMSNGTTYILDSPMIPASRSVYNIMTNDGKFDSEAYEAFYDLCEVNEDVVRACGLVDETNLTPTQQRAELKKYQVFINDNGPDFNVQFFNNYRYTIFVPTAEAINQAIAQGLPTWDEITADYAEMAPVVHELDSLKDVIKGAEARGETPNPEDVARVDELLPTAQADSLLLQTKVTYLINFVRYHFADNSVFVDKSTFNSTDYVTASYDNVKGLFCKINIQRPQSDVLQVQDANGGQWITAEGKTNVMARDVSCSKSPINQQTMNGITIDGTSFAVIHQIPGVLNHTQLVNGRYDSTWANTGEAKKYLKRFAIH
ncbi:MAG: hypothetical protein IJ197_08955 [Bacteroidaceae bacterium]|nr:hypothetical protein [Bacteroidaceae bacterium]